MYYYCFLLLVASALHPFALVRVGWLCVHSSSLKTRSHCSDSIAEIETDKASMAFEAQDDFYIAKILVKDGAEVQVGDPIFVSVEDSSSVSSFASYSSPAAAIPVSPAPAAVKTPPPLPTVPAPAPAPASAPAPAPVPSAATTAKPSPVSAKSAAVVVPPKLESKHIDSPLENTPLAGKLAAYQQEYIKKYGRSGHKPLVIPKSK